MNKHHDILKYIPHEHIQSQYVRADERFDIFKLGTFTVAKSLLNMLDEKSHASQPVEEIVELVELQPEATYQPHYHNYSSAVIYIVLGEGIYLDGNNEVAYQPGQRIDIPMKTAHGFVTKTKTLFLSIQTPPIRNRSTGEVDLHYVEKK